MYLNFEQNFSEFLGANGFVKACMVKIKFYFYGLILL